jgi:UPF0489 domain
MEGAFLPPARISTLGDFLGIKIGPFARESLNVNISFLNLDLDAFLDNVAHWIAGDERRDADHYKPWREAEVRAFLENQCHLKASRRVPGRFFVHHDQAFDFWRELVARHQTQIDLVHIDAHADLGLGDASWVHIVSELLRLPVARRSDPPRGSRFLNAGSYIAYALAARWIASMTYVHHPREGNDMPSIYFEQNNATPPNRIQLKAYEKNVITKFRMDLPTVEEAIAFEPVVPFTKVSVLDFEADTPFQYAALCKSPGFTPATSDALIPVFEEYIHFLS